MWINVTTSWMLVLVPQCTDSSIMGANTSCVVIFLTFITIFSTLRQSQGGKGSSFALTSLIVHGELVAYGLSELEFGGDIMGIELYGDLKLFLLHHSFLLL